jgi:TfoX/Sxy family transcriptional regulator of competence genes
MSTPKQTRFAWSRDKQTGRYRSVETYTLRKGGIAYAVAQKGMSGWFAYNAEGCPVHFNTSRESKSFTDATAEALKIVRQALEEEKAE